MVPRVKLTVIRFFGFLKSLSVYLSKALGKPVDCRQKFLYFLLSMPFENADSWRGSFEPGTVAFERSESVLRTKSIGTSSVSTCTTA